MKAFELFKVGKHTSMGGDSIAFSESDLQAAVAAYDPALHEAPIVVGHPKDNHPAFGWIKSLSYADGTITAEPQQVDESFAELVEKGRYKKRSASFYTPDAPNNPKPGTYYLRHVGFLGAMPPAVKGLKDVAFAGDDKAVEIEFADTERWAWGSVAALLRGLRDWMIGDKGLETADKLLPNFYITDIETAARAPADSAGMPAYSEDDPMKIEELQAQVATLTAENATLKADAAKHASFAEADAKLGEREKAIAARETAIARGAVEARAEAAVKAGRLLPKQKAGAVEFAMSLQDADAVLSFGEGDKAKKVTQREAYLLGIEQGPKLVEYGERSAAGEAPPESASDPQAIADKARQKVIESSKTGRTISYTEAVALVTAELNIEA